MRHKRIWQLVRVAALAATASLAFGSMAWAQDGRYYDNDDSYNRRDDARQHGYRNGYNDGLRTGQSDADAAAVSNSRTTTGRIPAASSTGWETNAITSELTATATNEATAAALARLATAMATAGVIATTGANNPFSSRWRVETDRCPISCAVFACEVGLLRAAPETLA